MQLHRQRASIQRQRVGEGPPLASSSSGAGHRWGWHVCEVGQRAQSTRRGGEEGMGEATGGRGSPPGQQQQWSGLHVGGGDGCENRVRGAAKGQAGDAGA